MDALHHHRSSSVAANQIRLVSVAYVKLLLGTQRHPRFYRVVSNSGLDSHRLCQNTAQILQENPERRTASRHVRSNIVGNYPELRLGQD
jgi:hypothetical protein